MTEDIKDVVERIEKEIAFHASVSLSMLCATSFTIKGARQLAADLRALLTAYGKEREAKIEAIRLMSKYASALGEMEGKYKAAHWPGIVDDWRERARLAEDQAAYWKAEAADQFKKRQAVEGELARVREGLGKIAEAITPPHRNGHYLQARNAVMIARQALRPAQEIGNGLAKEGL